MADSGLTPEQLAAIAAEMHRLQEQTARNADLMQQHGAALNDTNPLIRANGEAAKKAAETEKNYTAFKEHGINALKGFNSALLDTSAGFKKYQAGLEDAGKGMSSLLKNLGPLGQVAGLAVAGLTKFVGSVLEQTDAIVKSYDELSKLGANVGSSAGEIYTLGKNAGYTYHNLASFAKGVKSAQEGLVQLGGSVSGGIKSFGALAAVGEDNLKAYRRLGISQEELTDMQASYVKQLSMSGGLIAKTPKELQRESLQYIDTLKQLADLTGQDVKKLQEQQDLALKQENFNAYIFDLEQKRAEAKTQAEKEELTNRIANTKALAGHIMATDDAKTAAAKLEALSNENGAVTTESTARLKRMGWDADQYADILKKRGGAEQAVAKDMTDTAAAAKANREKLGENAYRLGEASRNMQDTFGYTNEMRKKAMDADKLASMTEEERKKYIEDQRKQFEEGKKAGKEGQGVMDATAQKEAMERSYRRMEEAMVSAVNPFINGSNTMTKAMEGLAKKFDELAAMIPKIVKFLDEYGKAILIGVGALAGLAALKKGFDKLKDIMGFGPKQLGSPGNPMHVTMGPGGGGPTLPGKGGASMPPPPGGPTLYNRRTGTSEVVSQSHFDRRTQRVEMLNKAHAAGSRAAEGLHGSERSQARRAAMVESIRASKAAPKPIPPVPAAAPKSASGAMGMMKQLGGGDQAGGGGGNILKGAAEGLAAFANPKILVGATIFSGTIAIIAAGLSASAYLLSLSMPSVAKGFKAFEELDGEKLISAGKGVAAVAGGLAAFGVGSAMAGIGNIVGNVADGLNAMFGGKSIFEKLSEFAAAGPYDVERIKNNSEAMVAFGKAMAAGGAASALGALGSIGNLVSGIADGLNNLVGGKSIYEKLTEFSEAGPYDVERIKNNSEAMVAFASGMAAAAAAGGMASLSSTANLVDSLIGGVNKLIKGKSIYEKLDEFASAGPYDLDRIENNTKALVSFALGMAAASAAGGGAALGELGNLVGNIFGGLSKMVGGKDIGEKLKDFASIDVDTAKVKNNAEAMTAFAQAMIAGVAAAGASGLNGLPNLVSSFTDGVSKLSGGKTIVEKLADFASVKVNVENAKNNAEAMVAFGKAMQSYPGGAQAAAGLGNMIANIADGVGKMFGTGTSITDKFIEFTKLDVGDVGKVKQKADAFAAFGNAMATFSGAAAASQGLGNLAEGFFTGLGKIFGNKDIIAKFVDFTKLDIDAKSAKEKAEAFKSFAEGIGALGGSRAGGGVRSGVQPVTGDTVVPVRIVGGAPTATTPAAKPATPAPAPTSAPTAKAAPSPKAETPEQAQQSKSATTAPTTDSKGKTTYTVNGKPATKEEYEKAVKSFGEASKNLQNIVGATGVATGQGGSVGGGGGGGGAPVTSGGSTGVGTAMANAGAAASTYTSKLVEKGPDLKAKAPKDDAEGKVGGGGAPVAVKSADSGDSAHGARKKTDGMIVHHTGGRGVQNAINTLKARGGLGYHYLVDQDGSITSYVPDDQVAWHAGNTDKVPRLKNSNTIGLSLVSKDDSDISREQLAAAFNLGKNIMNKYGISEVAGHGEVASHKMPTEGKTLADALRTGKLPETKIQAAEGGLVDGPTSGYPATLHGREIITPLKPDSILEKLANTVAEKDSSLSSSNSQLASIMSEMKELQASLYSMMENKFNDMIDNLENSVDVQEKLYKQSMV